MSISWDDHLLSYNEKKLKQTGAYFEKDAPEMFSLKMLSGTRQGLNDPASIFLSESAAKAWFGNEDPLNKMIKIDDKPVVKVTGVYENFPNNSTFTGLNLSQL
jgi:hypothetical protein